MLLHYILSTRKKQGTLPENAAACKSIVSTSLANRICEHYGAKMFEVLTGFKFIGEKIQQFQDTGDYTFQFGFEESYGFLSSTFVRDKDGVNASLLVTEVAAACEEEGITLYDRMQQIFREYGYYVEKVVSTTLPGKDGLTKMKEIMAGLRENPPAEIGGLKVTAVRDYLKGIRTADGKSEPTGCRPPTCCISSWRAATGSAYVPAARSRRSSCTSTPTRRTRRRRRVSTPGSARPARR